jgi:hypothetical protein
MQGEQAADTLHNYMLAVAAAAQRKKQQDASSKPSSRCCTIRTSALLKTAEDSSPN